MLEKMPNKQQVETRAKLYDIASETFDSAGYYSEQVKGGRMLDLGNGYFARISISICAPDKVQKYREEYAEQAAKNAERAEAKAEKERIKAEKALAKI